MSRTLAISIALALSQLACSASDSIEPLPVNQLRSAQLIARVDGKDLILSPYLYRDFQPVAPPDGQPLIAGLRVFAADSSAVPASIRVDAVWVVYGDQVWAATAGEERFENLPTPYYQVIARNGPKWGPGVRVDVVVRIRHSSNATSLLRAADQLIGRTD